MRISDWSSDVCSSDLNDVAVLAGLVGPPLQDIRVRQRPRRPRPWNVVSETIDGEPLIELLFVVAQQNALHAGNGNGVVGDSIAYAIEKSQVIDRQRHDQVEILKCCLGYIAKRRVMLRETEFPVDGVRPPVAFGNQYFHCGRSEEHTSELQSLMRISYAVFCLKK